MFYLVKNLFKPIDFVIMENPQLGRTRICDLDSNWSRIDALL
jgi:hypothetical protein